MGLNFALPPRELPIDSIIADVETTISMCDDEEMANAIRNEVETNIKTFNFGQSNKKYHNIKYSKATKSLKKKIGGNNIIITRADKGNKIVIMDKADYIQRVTAMLQNDIFIKVKKPQAKLNAWNKKSRDLVMFYIMDERFGMSLGQSNYQFPRLYALPKINKP
ncbi:uncharacterized protein LOC116351953, partial [Contarinia nasturtii]|uniref:uncharacterized protein LOC116351953 n=1 Tax=Contarinia nasturtii TaxID=265458 RepID=UPI0012D3D2FE